jgi:hypothetical protein
MALRMAQVLPIGSESCSWPQKGNRRLLRKEKKAADEWTIKKQNVVNVERMFFSMNY